MLHILWMIIKFILILIGIILGLLLLLLLLLLFCPVRYQAEGAKEAGSLLPSRGRARVSWLFGGISFSLVYSDGQTTPEFRLFGISVMKLLSKFRNRGKKKKSDPHEESLSEDSEFHGNDGGHAETHHIETAEEKIPELLLDETKHVGEEAEAFETFPSAEAGEETPSDPDAEKERRWQQTAEKLKKLFYDLGNKTRKIWDKIKAVHQRIMKIPEDLENLSAKKDKLCDKIDWWKSFIGHPRTQEAIALVRTKAIRLVRHVFPTKIEGELAFDCTDPSITGSILAVLGMTIPLHRNCIKVTPLFENRNVLYGNARLKGRVYGVMLVKTALEVYFDKNIKYVIRRWKHK